MNQLHLLGHPVRASPHSAAAVAPKPYPFNLAARAAVPRSLRWRSDHALNDGGGGEGRVEHTSSPLLPWDRHLWLREKEDLVFSSTSWCFCSNSKKVVFEGHKMHIDCTQYMQYVSQAQVSRNLIVFIICTPLESSVSA